MREKNSDFKLVNIERVQVENMCKQKTCINRVYVQVENKRKERSNVF